MIEEWFGNLESNNEERINKVWNDKLDSEKSKK